MGVTIHYRGSLTDKKQIHSLIDELEDIAKSVNGSCMVIDEDWSKKPDAHFEHDSTGRATIQGNCGLKGVILDLHEKCESLQLCFNASGLITSPLDVALSAEENYAVSPDDWMFIKTQFAGPEVHVAVVELLRYLKGKYIHDLEVHDETGYWENKDFRAVEQQMSLINRGIESISNRLETVPIESKDDIVKQIEIALRKMKEREDEQND